MLLTVEWMFFGKLRLCADAYIEKPFSSEYLQVQISNLLLNQPKIKEYFVSSPLVHIKSMAYTKTDELFLQKVNEEIYNNLEDTKLYVEKSSGLVNRRKTHYTAK